MMAMQTMILAIFVVQTSFSFAQQPPSPAGTPQHQPSGEQARFGAANEVHNQQHIQQHLDNQIDTSKQQQMTDDQMQFHYFKLHDLDGNNMLDGIELIKAITHVHGDDGYQPPAMGDKELEDMVDSIMKEDDFNGDGYIDYGEFLRAQKGRT